MTLKSLDWIESCDPPLRISSIEPTGDASRCDLDARHPNEYGAEPNRPGGRWRCGQCRALSSVFGP